MSNRLYERLTISVPCNREAATFWSALSLSLEHGMPVGVSRTAGMENGGPMTGTISASTLGPKRAQENFVRLMTHVASLYCMGGSSSISGYEAQELAMSVAYVLGIPATTAEDAVRMLDVEDPIELWRDGLTALDGRMDAALGV